jgi:hypothetical protein
LSVVGSSTPEIQSHESYPEFPILRQPIRSSYVVLPLPLSLWFTVGSSNDFYRVQHVVSSWSLNVATVEGQFCLAKFNRRKGSEKSLTIIKSFSHFLPRPALSPVHNQNPIHTALIYFMQLHPPVSSSVPQSSFPVHFFVSSTSLSPFRAARSSPEALLQ